MLLWTFLYKFLSGYFTSLGICLAVELLDRMVTLWMVIWGIAGLFSKEFVPFYIPTSDVWGFDFSTSLLASVVICLFDYSHPSENKAISHCDFDLHFPDDFEHLFRCLLAVCISSGKNIYSDPLSILTIVICLLLLSWVVYILFYQFCFVWFTKMKT